MADQRQAKINWMAACAYVSSGTCTHVHSKLDYSPA